MILLAQEIAAYAFFFCFLFFLNQTIQQYFCGHLDFLPIIFPQHQFSSRHTILNYL